MDVNKAEGCYNAFRLYGSKQIAFIFNQNTSKYMLLAVQGKLSATHRWLPLLKKISAVMRLTIILLLAYTQVYAYGDTRTTISKLSLKNAPAERVFRAIEKQTGYRFVYIKEDMQRMNPINLNVKHGELNEVLQHCFKNQPFAYVIIDRFIVVKSQVIEQQGGVQIDSSMPIEINGRVLDVNNHPIVGVSIAVSGENKFVTTDQNGFFGIDGLDTNDILIFRSVNMEEFEYTVTKQVDVLVTMRPSIRHVDFSNEEFINWLRYKWLAFLGIIEFLLFGKRILLSVNVGQLSQVARVWMVRAAIVICLEGFYHSFLDHLHVETGGDAALLDFFGDFVIGGHLLFTSLKAEALFLDKGFHKEVTNSFLYYVGCSVLLVCALFLFMCQSLGDAFSKGARHLQYKSWIKK